MWYRSLFVFTLNKLNFPFPFLFRADVFKVCVRVCTNSINFVGGGGGGGGGICDRDLKKATNQKKTKTYSYVRDSNLCVVFWN